MATTARRLTYDDLDAIPQERAGDRHELIDGELVVTLAPVPFHQIVSENIGNMLGNYLRANNLGRLLYAPTDVRLTDDNALIPDIIYIAPDRLHVIGPRTIDAAPDLVVEVLSSDTRQRDLGVKKHLYARFGVQEYWIADPDARTLTILSLQSDRFVATVRNDDEGVYTSRVIPGLRIMHDEVFSSIFDR